MRILVAAGLLISGCSRTFNETAARPRPPQASADARAVDWLIAQQASDDLWHSRDYGNLKGGAATTALVLYALAHVDSGLIEPHRERLQAACDRLAAEIDRQGCVAVSSGKDYPTYASAMLLVAVRKLSLQISPDRQRQLVVYLRQAQVDEPEGYSPADVDYGGWDMEGLADISRRTTGTNISVGTFVAEALGSADPSEAATQTVLARYRQWLARAQNLPGDGGFFYHTQREHDGNKAGWFGGPENVDRTRPRSYGTATADGIRGMLACGVSVSDASMTEAIRWIESHPALDRVPGLDDRGESSWSEGLTFYYWQSLACVFPVLAQDVRIDFARRLRREIEARQRADGSWRNYNARMREDDPLIATSFALLALSACRE